MGEGKHYTRNVHESGHNKLKERSVSGNQTFWIFWYHNLDCAGSPFEKTHYHDYSNLMNFPPKNLKIYKNNSICATRGPELNMIQGV
jgi:hypothetical protein